jgi:class 3 adenylate cyclase
MSDDAGSLPLPEHPELRQIAIAMEAAGMLFEIHDARFRLVYMSKEAARMYELSEEELLRQIGQSDMARGLNEPEDIVGISVESRTAWFRQNAPIIRHYVDVGDDDYEEIFPSLTVASAVEPIESPPRAWHDRITYDPGQGRVQRSTTGDLHFVHLRISNDEGRLIGVVLAYRGNVPDSLLHKLGRGDPRLFERMARVSEPARRPGAILFADLEASGVLSRQLSSRGYFELIRNLTDLIDASVVSRDGIRGKHAGDGGSALFLAADYGGSESAAARAAIEAACSIRDGSGQLEPMDVDITVNIGLHWGTTLMVGQVATNDRLEVTALGDQMNECSRIEAAATNGTILASKELLERLDATDAQALNIDPDAVAYTALAELAGGSDKVIRDAGSISVTAI